MAVVEEITQTLQLPEEANRKCSEGMALSIALCENEPMRFKIQFPCHLQGMYMAVYVVHTEKRSFVCLRKEYLCSDS